MSQRMRSDVAFDLCETNVLLEDVLDRVDRQARSRAADEQRRGRQRAIAAQVEILAHRVGNGIGRQRDRATPRGTAGDLNLTAIEIDIGDVESDELPDADARGEEQL